MQVIAAYLHTKVRLAIDLSVLQMTDLSVYLMRSKILNIGM